MVVRALVFALSPVAAALRWLRAGVARRCRLLGRCAGDRDRLYW